jgi:hypothetical protein
MHTIFTEFYVPDCITGLVAMTTTPTKPASFRACLLYQFTERSASRFATVFHSCIMVN